MESEKFQNENYSGLGKLERIRKMFGIRKWSGPQRGRDEVAIDIRKWFGLSSAIKRFILVSVNLCWNIF